MKRRICLLSLFLIAALAPATAQETGEPEAPQSGGWRRIGDPLPEQAPPATAYSVPNQLVLPAGAFVRIRVDEVLSSDRNRPGDMFLATLDQPLVVDGLVVARRGQTVAGRVVDVTKAGRVKGTSQMALELTEITFADGRQLPVRSQLIEYAGGTAKGRDLTTIGTVAGTGAAIGAIADGGFGAGMGALAGAGASLIGVLITRGHATTIYPEAGLTFRTLQPLAIPTGRSAHAFHPVEQSDYESRLVRRAPAPPPPAPYGLYGGWGYPGWGWDPWFWGPGPFFGPRMVFIGGRGFYGGRRFGGGRGFGGRRW